MTTTTITLDRRVKKRLDRLKRHPREAYNDVIVRILGSPLSRSIDIDGLYETIEILSDPDVMRSLARSMDDLNTGRLHDIDDV